jgi:hypothetical protein
MDLVKDQLGINQLHNAGITGKGVIIAIYDDSPFYFKFNDFRKEDGTTRILFCQYCGDKTVDTLRGPDLTSEQINEILVDYPMDTFNDFRIRDGYHDNTISSHSTILTAIAAGNGLSVGRNGEVNSQYKGIAPEADIFIIKGSESTYELDLLDSISKTQKKPVVTVFTRAYSYPTNVLKEANEKNPGRIHVVSAGNDNKPNAIDIAFGIQEGTKEIVLKKENLKTHDNLSFYQYEANISFEYNAFKSINLIDIDNDTFTISENDSFGEPILEPNMDMLEYKYVSPLKTIQSDEGYPTHNFSFCNYDTSLGDYKMIFKRSDSSSEQLIPIKFNMLTMWEGDLFNNSYSTLSYAGSKENFITVGAYYHRHVNNNPDGTVLGDIASFSGRGPDFIFSDALTINGPIKPEITAPGINVITLLGHGPFTMLPDSIHGYISGTSVSAPIVAGMAALLLQINPNLNVDDIKEILKNHALIDSFVGSVPNYTWGWGKAYLSSDNNINEQQYFIKNNTDIRIEKISYNYQSKMFIISFYIPNYDKGAVLTIYNIKGDVVKTYVGLKGEDKLKTLFWYPSNSSRGTYLFVLKSKNQIDCKKELFLK